MVVPTSEMSSPKLREFRSPSKVAMARKESNWCLSWPLSDSTGNSDSKGQLVAACHPLILVLFIFMIQVWDFTFPSWIREAGQSILLVESLISKIVGFSVSSMSCALFPSLLGVPQSLSWSCRPCLTWSASHPSESLQLLQLP